MQTGAASQVRFRLPRAVESGSILNIPVCQTHLLAFTNNTMMALIVDSGHCRRLKGKTNFTFIEHLRELLWKSNPASEDGNGCHGSENFMHLKSSWTWTGKSATPLQVGWSSCRLSFGLQLVAVARWRVKELRRRMRVCEPKVLQFKFKFDVKFIVRGVVFRQVI